MTDRVLVTRKRILSAIWILPLLAMIITGWLFYTGYRDAGVEITIIFSDATGIIPGKTRVIARGIPVGLVKKTLPDLVRQQVEVVVNIEKMVADHLVEDTLFWVVRPQLSARSVEGLDTILSGSYIGVQSGSSTTPRRHFVGLESSPPVPPGSPGLRITLRAETLGSIQVGTDVYYRNIAIGSVQSHQLERDEHVLIDLYIEPQFAHLVRKESRFCNASGIQISGKLPKLKILVESLAALLRGGILLHTPEQLQDGPPAGNGQVFPLFPDFESANYGIPMTLTLASSDNIVEGSTKVIYRGLEAGFVHKIEINNDQERTVTAHILLDPRAELILREGTRFWLVKPEISPSGFNNLHLLLDGAHITFQPGEGAFRNHFDILSETPPQMPLRPGRSYQLKSDLPSEVSAKSPVYYKKIQVGKVIDVGLERSGQSVVTTIFIYEEHLHLLSAATVFWVHSGLQFSAGFEHGLSLLTGPLAQIFSGGVSFTTPDLQVPAKRPVPEEGSSFQLHPSQQEAFATSTALQPSAHKFQLIAEKVDSLSVGSPLLYKNIKIGEITAFTLTPRDQEILVDCLIEPAYQHLLTEYTRCYNLSGLEFSADIQGFRLQTGSLQSIITGGIGCYNPAGNDSTAPASPIRLYPSYAEAQAVDDLELTVDFPSASNLATGSPVRYQGIEVGRVSRLHLAEDLKTVTGTVRVEGRLAPLFRAGTRIWVEKAEVTLGGINNLESVIFGSFLSFLPGGGPPVRHFTALAEPPRGELVGGDGLQIVLETSNLGSLSIAAPVYYRRVEVGRVTGWQLSPTFQKVQVFVTIDRPFLPLIRQNTRFWKVSGTRISGGIFSGLTVATESLVALVRGGIALATPDNNRGEAAVAGGHLFPLEEEAQPEWLDWSPDIVLLELEKSRHLIPAE